MARVLRKKAADDGVAQAWLRAWLAWVTVCFLCNCWGAGAVTFGHGWRERGLAAHQLVGFSAVEKFLGFGTCGISSLASRHHVLGQGFGGNSGLNVQ